MSYFAQSKFDSRCEWGLPAVEHLASDVIVIVDVLSFSTSVEIATNRGAKIFPYQWKDETGFAYANEKEAQLASTRDSLVGQYSLAPSSLIAVPSDLRLVLPSPNGSTIAFRAMSHGCTVVAGCLRNAKAVGAWLRSNYRNVTVIPAGERWPDDSLRCAIEDLIGAGAILREVNGSLSPEARLAIAAFEAAEANLLETIAQSGSGQELVDRGFTRDVELASEINASDCVPILEKDHFR